MAIELGGHLFSTPHCTLEESARIWHALGIRVMDLGNGRDLDPNHVALNIDAEADRVRAIGDAVGMRFHDVFPQATDKHITNTPDSVEYEHQRKVNTAWIEFAAKAGMDGVTLSPGIYWPGLTVEQAFNRSRDQLRVLVDVAAEFAMNLRIEPHVDSVTWSPELALRMLDEVPGLSFTLDHSHFVFHGMPYEQIALMHPHGTHWHARQASLSRLQARFDEGTVDFGRIVADLTRHGYNGVIALEVVTTPWLELDRTDVLTETVLLRDQLRALLNPAHG